MLTLAEKKRAAQLMAQLDRHKQTGKVHVLVSIHMHFASRSLRVKTGCGLSISSGHPTNHGTRLSRTAWGSDCLGCERSLDFDRPLTPDGYVFEAPP